jgi:CRP-like cAMP-binding protein
VYTSQAPALPAAAGPDSELARLLQRYTQALLVQIAQAAACTRAHPLEARCARWLLMTRDRVDSDEFLLTQEFLAQMLGVRRPTVNIVARALQRAGLIRYSRGRMTLLDRPGLEATACECYAIIRREYDRFCPS